MAFILLYFLLLKETLAEPYNENLLQCEPIHIDFCKDVGYYNWTIKMTTSQPNPYTGKTSQRESLLFLKHWDMLLEPERTCSKHLRILLCSVYLPFCSGKINRPITACRSLCLEVKSKCYKIMKVYNLPWPPQLNCSQFPETNGFATLCLDGGLKDKKTTLPAIIQTTTTQKSTLKIRKTNPTNRVRTVEKPSVTKITSGRTFCKVLYARNNKNYLYVEKIQACALGCMADGLFTFSEKQLTEKWLSALSCTCVVLCIMSLFVVVFDYHKTSYPERTIIFITICYLFYALAYVIRILYTREDVTCNEEDGRRYLLIDGSGNISCAATFLLAYCFSIAQNVWWVLLCLCWFLSAGMKWSSDTIKSKATYFHVMAWGVPCAITVVILVLRKIDVNELTGICSVGNRYENLTALRAFILGPLFTFLIMGIMFLLFGFIALLRISNTLNDELLSRVKLRRPLTPIAFYAALHTFFSTFILASYFYEYFNKIIWYDDLTSPGPNFFVFLLRVITDFFIGISSSIWILTIHAPTLYRKFKLKLFKTEMLMQTGLPPDQSVLDPLRGQAGTNETSI